MVLKFVLIVAIVAAIVTLSVKGFLNNKAQNAAVRQDGHSLIDIARKKKSEGRSKVVVPGLIVDYAGADMDLNEALKNYSVVIAEPIASKSFTADSTSISTWYKFRITETLSRKNYVYCYTCSPVPPPPSELGKPNPDEFFLDTVGGVLNIEGVEVTATSRSSLAFELGKKYLMFVSLTPSQVAVLASGPSGVFQLDEEKNLHSLNNSESPIPREVQKRFGLKLSEFKSHINQ